MLPSVTPGPAARPIYRRAPAQLRPEDLDKEVLLDPRRECTRCGHVIDVARVVRLSDGEYAYACLGCAVRFRRGTPTPTGGTHKP